MRSIRKSLSTLGKAHRRIYQLEHLIENMDLVNHLPDRLMFAVPKSTYGSPFTVNECN